MRQNPRQRMFLVFHGRYPGEKAAALFAAKSAESFAAIGLEVTLLVPRRIGREKGDPYSFFGVNEAFKVTYLPVIDLLWLPFGKGISFVLSFTSFSLSTLVYLLLYARKDAIVYSNESLPILLASFVFPETCYEVHDFPERHIWLYRALFGRVKRIVATNEWKRSELTSHWKIPSGNILVEPNAVDVQQFANAPEREEARRRLGVSAEISMVAYTGHLYSWKGVDTLAEAARLMPDTAFYLVGGTDEDVARKKKEWADIKNVHLVGFRPHEEVPLWQRAADVLVLPNTAKEEISTHYTSPMKLFEYMASRTPIVASDLPSVREIAEGCAILCHPDDSSDLRGKIEEVLGGRGSSQAEKAGEWVKEHTWGKRAKRIIDKIVKE